MCARRPPWYNPRVDAWLLVLHIPDRPALGALEPLLRKTGLQFVHGCQEPAVKARYADTRGLLLTVAGWQPAALSRGRGAPRITLPEAAVGFLDAVADAHPRGFEVAVVAPAHPLRRTARVDPDRLAGPLAAGCRYEVHR